MRQNTSTKILFPVPIAHSHPPFPKARRRLPARADTFLLREYVLLLLHNPTMRPRLISSSLPTPTSLAAGTAMAARSAAKACHALLGAVHAKLRASASQLRGSYRSLGASTSAALAAALAALLCCAAGGQAGGGRVEQLLRRVVQVARRRRGGLGHDAGQFSSIGFLWTARIFARLPLALDNPSCSCEIPAF